MADIRRRIERVIETDPVIKKGLQRRIINARALVRYILEADGIEATPDAILGVLRRYPLAVERRNEFHEVFKDTELAVRNKVGDMALENSQQVMRRIAEFASNLKTSRGENLRVVVGHRYVRVLSNQKAIESFRQTFDEDEVARYSSDLAEISILLPSLAERTKGIIAKITTELVLNDINIVGIMCCNPELILLVADNDAARTLETLQRMLKEETGRPLEEPKLLI